MPSKAQDPSAQRDVKLPARHRIGLLTTDPLRLLGLQGLFEQDSQYELVPLTVPGSLDLAGFNLVVLDANCTGHILELLAGFHRKHPRLKLIVVGVEEDHSYIQRVIGAGAKGYLTHLARESEVRMAIEVVLDGSVWAPRKVLAKLIEGREVEQTVVEAKPPRITVRETEVLRLLIAGHPNREIAECMGIDPNSVKAHIGRLMRKVGVENRIALSIKAVEWKLLSPR